MGEQAAANGAGPTGAVPDPAIRLDGVSKRLGDYVAVESADFDIAEGGWNLFHPIVAGLEQTVAQALGSAVTSDQNQINTSGIFNISQIPWAKVTTATHWGLVSKMMTPLIDWEVLAPEDSITVDEDSREIKVTVDGAWGAGCGAQPSGFIGAAA